MAQAAHDALGEIVAKDTWTHEDYEQALKLLFEVPDAAGKFKSILAKLVAADPEPRGGAALKIGIVRFVLCRFSQALEALSNATDNKDRRYFQALCYKHLRENDKATEEFERAQARGWDADAIELELIELKALTGDLDAADAALRKLEKRLGDAPGWLYRRGLVNELSGRGEEAADCYERVRAIDGSHSGATFRLAYYLDLHGAEDRAIELYRECVQSPPIHANALLNLAVLYEDAGEYDKAVDALRAILATNPSHPRARLFVRDVTASKTMYYDEDQARRLARRNAVLDIPVTDFELSVRARNCLKKMNIRTLGDLIKTTETDLLAYKNFGETSLKEIKEMLAAKGLRLGQALEEGTQFADLFEPLSVNDEGVLATPVAKLGLSVRANNALESLKVGTLGELVTRTDADLLACRNFGQTSLNEVKQKLAEYGLKLRETT